MTCKSKTSLATVAALIVVVLVDLICVHQAIAKPVARIPEHTYTLKVRMAKVDWKWAGPLNAYTGGSYSTGHVNQLWQMAPRGKRRGIVLAAAVRYHVPFRLLLGVWGAESGFGRYACHFGLTGYFPGTGTSGNFARDARLAARLFARLYWAQWHKRSV